MTRTRPSVPWALLLPVATTALFVLWWTNREERASGPPFTPHVEDHRSVEGWGAALDLGADRGRLSVRLWPLHSEPEVQAFDAAALARRLELAAGEPWIAELSWARPVDAGPGQSAGRERLEAGQLTVRDARGEALAPLLPSLANFAEDGPADPLRVLLAPPLEGLGPEQSLSVLLWGRAPVHSEAEGNSESKLNSETEGDADGQGAPRLAGLQWSDGAALGALELEPVTHALDGLPRDLARFSADGREDAEHSGVR